MKLVIDIETQNSFKDIGSRRDLTLLKLSLAVVYNYQDNKYYTFTEDSVNELENLFTQTEYIIGFNTIGFDLPVMQQYMKKVRLLEKKQIDMMAELEKELGYRVSLDSVAKATLGNTKISHGLEAINMWNEGRLEELEAYCKEDVKLTKDIYEFGLENKFVKFNAGWDEYQVPVDW